MMRRKKKKMKKSGQQHGAQVLQTQTLRGGDFWCWSPGRT
jgi:hypothetical protein